MHRGVMIQTFEWNSPADGGHWRYLAEKAKEFANLGATAVWMPPAYKSMDGPNGTGYATYDLYDLGEFDQKGSVRTKYGTKDEFLAAVKAVRAAGMSVYADVVFNHRMGGDAQEEVEVEPICCDNRNQVMGETRKVKVWSKFDFPGRGDKYSAMKWNWQHFNAFSADSPDDHCIYRVKGKSFSGEVCFEYGNYDYLMGADVDVYHPEVRADLFRWGEWMLEIAELDGFRLDAVKHIPASFYKDWFNHLRAKFPGREVFGVAEYWSGNLDELKGYMTATDGMVRLFDAPLHYKLFEASKKGRDFDLRQIFDGTLVQDSPLMAVTFVDNHDSQPGQSLESWVEDWFKPLAYALILLRMDGYPCVFAGDYLGNDGEQTKLTSHRKLIDDMLQARAKFMYGDQHDYFDHPNCVGWVWSGDAEHPGSMVVLMSTGEAGAKRMKTFHGQHTFRDVTGHWPEPVTTDDNGEGDFHCPPGKVSIWCMV